jgi:hypothetical protein
MLNLSLPVHDATKFKSTLLRHLEEKLIPQGPAPGEHLISVLNAEVGVTWTTQRAGGKTIFGFIQARNANADIGMNALVILADRIRAKEQICADLSLDCPRWLALFNDYWLADADTYLWAYREAQLPHGFERIYMVTDHGQVTALYGEA